MNPPPYVLSAPGEAPGDTELEDAEGYDEFRTGLDFGDVRRLLALEQRKTRDFTPDYMFVSRSTVLGRFREIKLDMWEGREPPSLDVTCEECRGVVDLEAICVDCGECHDCCSCEFTPQDDFWRENPWGINDEWLISP